MAWLSGSPSVSVTLNPELTPFIDCADCLLAYMGGWAKYVLESDGEEDPIGAGVAGIEAAIKLYDTNAGVMGEIASIEKFKKLKERRRLERHVKQHLQ